MNSGDRFPERNHRSDLSVRFKCCNVYGHIYLIAQEAALFGWFPRCAVKLEIKVDPGGTDARIFEAG